MVGLVCIFMCCCWCYWPSTAVLQEIRSEVTRKVGSASVPARQGAHYRLIEPLLLIKRKTFSRRASEARRLFLGVPGRQRGMQRGLRVPQKAVSHIVRINVLSGNRVHRVIADRYRSLAGTYAGAWNIKHRDGTVLRPEKTVIDVASVDVLSRDRPTGVDVTGCRALTGPCACSRNAERGNSAVGSTHETVNDIA